MDTNGEGPAISLQDQPRCKVGGEEHRTDAENF